MRKLPDGPLVSTDWLSAKLNEPSIRVVDASWYLPAMKRNGYTEYQNLHIPGAVFWDIDEVADKLSNLPHTFPSNEQFQAQMKELGIGDDTTVIVYDGMGLFSAARPWWILNSFGHKNVFVLNGGLPKWMAEGRPLNKDRPEPRLTTFTGTMNKNFIRTVEEVIGINDSQNEQLLDARAEGRFLGRESEPRPGCRMGHIPGSKNLPFDHLVDPQTKTLLSVSCLKSRFSNAGIDIEKPLVTSCGSGVTACVLALGMYALNKKNVSVYDGSWSEWGSDQNLPIETD